MVRFNQLNKDTGYSIWDAVEVESPALFGDKKHCMSLMCRNSKKKMTQGLLSENLDREGCRSGENGPEERARHAGKGRQALLPEKITVPCLLTSL